jgi:hypothetical protein
MRKNRTHNKTTEFSLDIFNIYRHSPVSSNICFQLHYNPTCLRIPGYTHVLLLATMDGYIRPFKGMSRYQSLRNPNYSSKGCAVTILHLITPRLLIHQTDHSKKNAMPRLKVVEEDDERLRQNVRLQLNH